MAEPTPANKAAETPENKAAIAPKTATKPAAKRTATAPKAPAQKVYRMKTPDGGKYATPDKAEAEHLNRTRGYTFTN